MNKTGLFWIGGLLALAIAVSTGGTQMKNDFLSTTTEKDRDRLLQLEKKVWLKDASAMSNLGEYYELGVFVAKDENKALELYKKAALRGNITASHNAAMILFNRKDKHFLGYAQQAASQQFIPSMRFIGQLYIQKGDAKERILGMHYLLKSASKGDVDSMVTLAGYPDMFNEKNSDLLWYYIAKKNAKTEKETSNVNILESTILMKYKDQESVKEIISKELPSFYHKYLVK